MGVARSWSILADALQPCHEGLPKVAIHGIAHRRAVQGDYGHVLTQFN